METTQTEQKKRGRKPGVSFKKTTGKAITLSNTHGDLIVHERDLGCTWASIAKRYDTSESLARAAYNIRKSQM